MRARSVLTLPIALLTLSSGALGEPSRTAEQAAADGTRLLAAGSYSEAARAYTEAIGEHGVHHPEREGMRGISLNLTAVRRSIHCGVLGGTRAARRRPRSLRIAS